MSSPVGLRLSGARCARSALGLTALVLAGSALLAGAAAVAAGGTAIARRGALGSESRVCRAPRLTGLVVSVARERAATAGCAVRLEGAQLTDPNTQTIRRQTPGAGRHGRVVFVWVNPLCSGSAAAGPGISEPLVTPGPTELVSGLYVVGGPLRRWSEPRCKARAGEPEAGTITVREPATGSIVATQAVAGGHFATIPLAPGTYTVQGTFAGAMVNERAAQSFPETVAVEAGKSVRQDVFLDVP